MTELEIKTYKNISITSQNITISYDGKSDEVILKIDKILNNGSVYMTKTIDFHPSYIQPIIDMLGKIKENTPNE